MSCLEGKTNRSGTLRRSGDQGSATVWMVVATAVLCLVFGAVLAMSQVVVARHRASTAADLAALAAADLWSEGGARACAGAGRVAEAQGARLVRCVLSGQISDVTVVAATGPFSPGVRSRAGPAEAVSPGSAVE